MTRTVFLTIVSGIAFTIGLFALLAPGVLISVVKVAPPSATANVMARTVGVLLFSVGALNFLVRRHEDSPTLRAVLIFDLVLQIAILPVDPIAYAQGVYTSVAAFLPNTLLHLALVAGFAYYLADMSKRARSSVATSR